MSAYGSRSLKKGDTGPDVQEIQVRLALFGSKNHSVSCSEKFDDNFELAVRRFQKIFGLNETGMVDASVFQFIENLAIQNASDVDKIFSEYKCKCQTRSAANLEKMVDIWNGHVAGKCKRTDGSLAKKIKTSGSGATFKVVDGLECKGFGSQLTKVALTSANTWSFSGYSDVTENPGMHRILGWALFMFLQLLKKNKENEAISLDIGTSHNGYRCNLDYYHVCRFAKKGAAMTNHTGNAVDLHVKCKKKLTFPFTAKTIPPISTSSTDHCISLIDWLEEFGVVTGDRVKVEGVKPKPFKEGATNTLRTEGFAKTGTWTHIDATTYAYKAYVTNAADLFSPRYTAGSATSPVVPPQSAPKTPPTPKKSEGGGAASGASSPSSSLDDLLRYAENSKEWFQTSFSSFFDAYREGQIADAHDAIQSDDGFFPVGKNLTWHGGIHAVGQADGSVHAITDGVVVAARIPDKDPAMLSFGSRNFVLVKHQTPAGKPFWSLYMHLRPIPLKVDDPKLAMLFPWLVRQKLKLTGGDGSNFRVSPEGEAGVLRTIGKGETLVSIEAKVVGTQKWIKAKADKDGLVGWLALTSRFEVKSEIDQLAAIQAGKVVNLNLPVKRGDCLGYMSPPKPGKKPFLHWEIFSDQVVSNQWLQVKDEDNDIVCDAVKFKELLNKSKAVTFFDSLTDSDIVSAYSDPKISAEIRKRAYFFKSEWAVEWKSALEKLKDDFEVDDLAPRLEPYNFWKDAEAAKCDIPKGGKVWHYRPPEFIAREFPAAKTQAEPEKPTPTTQNGNYTIIDKKAVVREASPPHKSTTETIPYFSKITVNSVSGEFATVQIGGAGAMKVTKKTNYVAFIKDDPRFQNVGMAPSVPVAIESGWSSSKKLTASTYNRLGGLLKAISDALGLEVAAAIAVWRVESGGKAHTPNQAIIRFENHHFWNFWGKNNAAQFDKSFTFGGHGTTTGKSYQGHKVSKDGGTTWSDFHGDQTKEYDVLNYASTFDKEAARKSISIGGCQIMISNHAICGYKTASEMYDAFQASEKSHVLGFFDFCKFCSGWHSGNDTMFNFAKAKDWVAFASKYNGPSNKDTYGALIETAYNEAKDVLP